MTKSTSQATENGSEPDLRVIRGGGKKNAPVSQINLAQLLNTDAKIAFLSEQIKATKAAQDSLSRRLKKLSAERTRIYGRISEAMERGAEIEPGPHLAFLKHHGRKRTLVVK